MKLSIKVVFSIHFDSYGGNNAPADRKTRMAGASFMVAGGNIMIADGNVELAGASFMVAGENFEVTDENFGVAGGSFGVAGGSFVFRGGKTELVDYRVLVRNVRCKIVVARLVKSCFFGKRVAAPEQKRRFIYCFYR